MSLSKLIVLIFFPCLLFGQQRKIDSLLKALSNKKDTAQVELFIQISDSYQYNNIEKALQFIDSATILANKLKYKSGIARIMLTRGAIYTTAGNYDLAIKCILEAIPLNKELKKFYTVANCYNSLGNVYIGMNDTNKAYINYLESNNISKQHNLESLEAVSGLGLANIFILKKEFSKAIDYMEVSIKYFKKINNPEYIGSGYTVIAEAYLGQKNFLKAKDYYTQALQLFKTIDNKYGIAMVLGSLSYIESERGNHIGSISLLKEAISINKERQASDNIRQNALDLAKQYEKLGEPNLAVDYYKQFIKLNDSLFNDQKTKSISELEKRFENKQRDAELKLKNTELEASQSRIKSKNYLILIFIISIFVFLFFTFLLLQQIKKNKKANQLLQTQNTEINFQKDIIENKNKDIIDSINYSKHIQQAIIPSASMFKNYVSQSFVIYKPKDIVSGDFYFIEQQNDLVCIAVVDCTGHGVPGAMLSVFIHSNLKSIIKSNQFNNNPAEILKELCSTLNSNLYQGSKKRINDGADMGLCFIDKQKRQITFSGARTDLYKLENNSFETFKGDRLAISSSVIVDEVKFTNKVINFTQNSIFYLNTDGFSDQFGGDVKKNNNQNGKKFKQSKLNELYIKYNALPLHEQADNLLNDFYEWKGKFEQTDDVTVLGFKI